MEDEYIQFSKSGCFYEMVATFMIAASAVPAFFNKNKLINFDPSERIIIQGVQVKDKHIYPHQTCEQIQAGHATQAFYIGQNCLMLASLAYETVKELNDHTPEFEFFRHVRNASSHMNKFSFHNNEPRRPAAWKGIILDHTKQGDANPMQNYECFGRVLGPADILVLLADIEKRLLSGKKQ